MRGGRRERRASPTTSSATVDIESQVYKVFHNGLRKEIENVPGGKPVENRRFLGWKR